VTTAALSLSPVRVDPSRGLRVSVGLRPFRPGGFVVRAERLGNKTVVHDYGHGGCGITLSWGTARLALEEALRTPHREAAVLGAGAVGLAAARVLQAAGFAVTVYAKSLPPHTTSDAAGAFWAPFSLCDAGAMSPAFVARLARAARESRDTFEALARAPRYGVRRLPLYYLDAEPPALSPEMSAAPELFRGDALPPGEHPFGDRHALRMAGLTIEPAAYLPAVLDDVRRGGGRVVVRDFPDLAAVAALPEPLVVNCTGLGARALFGDSELEPVRGQLAVVEPQPEIDYMVVAPREGLYMLPRRDGIVLGTTHERGSWDLAPSAAETARLLAGHAALIGGGTRVR
jgi:glycine/D-amino acid oxidase-like deaminating enzyme